ncbi:unnamed protein product, partial [Linum tenue]
GEISDLRGLGIPPAISHFHLSSPRCAGSGELCLSAQLIEDPHGHYPGVVFSRDENERYR